MALLDILLPEILPTIFKFLSLEDRKEVRLTCHAFKDACDRADIVNHEKFVFHSGNLEKDLDTEDVDAICSRLRSEVVFIAFDLIRLPLPLWEGFGAGITSLFMDACSINDEIIVRIFLHCSMLVNFHLGVFGGRSYSVTGLNNAFDRLIALRIQRPKLESLKLFTCFLIKDETFTKIIKIFPNIRTFGRCQYNSAPIDLPPSVERFLWCTNSNHACMVPYINQPTLRLKELEIACLRISTNQKMYDTVDFFAGQKELRKVYLTLHHASAEPRLAKTVMFYLLRKLPKLEVLKFHSDCQLKLSEYEYGDLVTTIRNLESLDLRFIECSLEDPSTFTKHRLPSMKYPKLKHLRLNIGSTDEVTRIQTEILSRCRSSLESLSLGVVDLDTVALICTDHIDLRKLTLNLSRYGTIPTERPSFGQLRKLEYLEVRNIHDGLLCISDLISELNCPKLRSFVHDVEFGEDDFNDGVTHLCSKETIELLNGLSEKAPLLETLRFNSTLPIKDCYEHFGKFKKLRYLVRDNLWENVDKGGLWNDDYVELFDVCPSLTYAVHIVINKFDRIVFNRWRKSFGFRYDHAPQFLCKALNIPAYDEY